MAPTAEEFERLLTQLKERMDRGQGETIYEIGVGGKGARVGEGGREGRGGDLCLLRTSLLMEIHVSLTCWSQSQIVC